MNELVLSKQVPLDRHPAAVYIEGLAPGSKRAMRASLDLIATELTGGIVDDAARIDWSALRFQHAAAVRARLAAKYAPASVNRHLSALRGVARAAWRLEQLPAEDYQRIADLDGVRGTRLPAGRELGSDERASLYEECACDENRAAGARDAAILALLDGAGLRRAEIAALDMAHVTAKVDEVRVLGKGSKERLVPLTNGTRDAVLVWLEARGRDVGPLFCAVGRSGRIRHEQRLTDASVYSILRRRAKAAGIEDLSPHDFRRTMIGELIDGGADLVTVAALVGHSSVQTTARYDRRGERAKRRAVAMRTIGYVK